MKSQQDEIIDRSVRSYNADPRYGGKVLQRLFYYQGRRDPELNDEVLALLPVPEPDRPPVVLTEQARTAAPQAEAAPSMRSARARRPSEEFAAKIIEASTALAERAAPAAPPGPGVAPSPPTWQPLGPSLIPNGQTYGGNRVDVIGRVASIAIDPKNPKHLLCGGAGGGIWESFDDGASWAPRTDAMPSLATGAVAFDPQNPKTVYAGSGEGNFYRALGAGVFKSTDGGTTWAVAASAPFVGSGFFDLVVDPKDSKTLYAATTIGFAVSTNSGATWKIMRNQLCWDISVSPAGGKAEILAAFADGLFVSTNSGASFAPVALPNAPAGVWTRLAVDRVTTAPDVAYVFGAAGSAAHLWRRAGAAWTKITSLPALNIGQAWYDWYVAAPPDKKDQVFIGAIDTFRGSLSGSTWTWVNITTQGNHSIHPDQHCLAFSPQNSQVIYLGNDGGIFRSSNSGGSWTALNKGLGITEVTYLGSDPNTSKWLMAGLQDNGTIRYTGSSVWDHIADGDGGDCGVNPLNPNEIYHSYYNVSLERSNNKGNTWINLSPPSVPSVFYPPVEVYGTTVAIGGASLVVTRTGAPPWTTFPLGLAGNDVATAMRIVDANTIYIGSATGQMMKVTWSGSSWHKTPLTSPSNRYISCIAIDPNLPNRLWVTFSQLGGGLVFRSDNGGAAWTNHTAGLPTIPMNSVVVDPANSKRVWVAADVGVYQSLDEGRTWSSFSNGLPHAMAADLVFHKKDRVLFCGTRNRGAWVISVPSTAAVA